MLKISIFCIVLFTFAAYIAGTSLENGLFVGTIMAAFLYSMRKE